MKELLKLSRNAIEKYFNGEKVKPSEEIIKKYSENKACFVTLTKNKNLRGCIGSIYPRQVLWKDVIDNSINSAFNDSRFPPLRKEELPLIKIEISVLTYPKKIEFRKPEELLKKLSANCGVILQKKLGSATYLPQVWNQIPEKREFLESLSLKAGLPTNAWETADIWAYEVEKISE